MSNERAPEAGRNFDAWIAETLMDYDLGTPPNPELAIPPGKNYPVAVPRYSTNIADAWRVVERITAPPATIEEARRAWNTKFVFLFTQEALWAYSAADAAYKICYIAWTVVHHQWGAL